MKINKYIIREKRKGFKTYYQILDEFENSITQISFKFSGMMNAVDFGGARYTMKKRSMFSYRHDIFKDGVLICDAGLKNGFSSEWLIQFSKSTIYMKSKLSFKNISFIENENEIAKASRKNKGFKTIFGLAVNENIDAMVLIISLVTRLKQIRATMAAT